MRTETINGHEYEIGELLPLKALNVGRRIAPILAHALPALTHGEFESAAGPIADALAKMTDDDFTYVINECLAVCQRKQAKGWARVMVNGNLMFHDTKPSSIITLARYVIEDSLSDFFSTSQPESPAKE